MEDYGNKLPVYPVRLGPHGIDKQIFLAIAMVKPVSNTCVRLLIWQANRQGSEASWYVQVRP